MPILPTQKLYSEKLVQYQLGDRDNLILTLRCPQRLHSVTQKEHPMLQRKKKQKPSLHLAISTPKSQPKTMSSGETLEDPSEVDP